MLKMSFHFIFFFFFFFSLFYNDLLDFFAIFMNTLCFQAGKTLQINNVSLKILFNVLGVKLAVSLISRVGTLRVRGKQKMSGFFCRLFYFSCTDV